MCGAKEYGKDIIKLEPDAFLLYPFLPRSSSAGPPNSLALFPMGAAHTYTRAHRVSTLINFINYESESISTVSIMNFVRW